MPFETTKHLFSICKNIEERLVLKIIHLYLKTTDDRKIKWEAVTKDIDTQQYINICKNIFKQNVK